MADAPPLLACEGLTREFGSGRSWFGKERPALRAVDGVTLSVAPGEALGVVGESGCGKSTAARMLAGLLEPTSGVVRFAGQDLSALDKAGRLAFRRGVQLVFQDPVSSLNPRKTVRKILEGPLETLLELPRGQRRERVDELMREVGLRPEFADRYPHEFSGGQAQRVGIARALAPEPKLLVLDEPVSALDVSVQAQVLKLLRGLQEKRGLAYLFISHDLAVVEALCDRVAVMRAGKVVEEAPRQRLFRDPEHPYTRELLSAVPRLRAVG